MPSPSVTTRSAADAEPLAEPGEGAALAHGGVDELDVLGLRADDVQPPAPALLQARGRISSTSAADVTSTSLVGGRRTDLGRQVGHGVDADLHVLGVAPRPLGDLLHVQAVVDVGVELAPHARDVTHDLGRRLAVHGHVAQPLPAREVGDQRALVAHHRAPR